MLKLGNRWLNQALKENAFVTIAALLANALFAAAWVYTSYIMMWLLDGYYAGPAAFMRAAIINIVAYLAMCLLGYVTKFTRAMYIRKTNLFVRKQITASIVRDTEALLSSKNTGKKLSWYLNDVDELENKYFDSLLDGFRNIVMVVLAFIAIVMVHWSFAIAAAVLFFISALVPSFINKFIERAQSKLTLAKEEYTEGVRDNLESVYTLFIADKLAYFLKRMAKQNESRENKYYAYNMTMAKTESGLFFVNLGSQFALIVFALCIASLGYASPGSAFSIGALSGNLFNGISGIMQVVAVIFSVSAITDKYTQANEEQNKTDITGVQQIELRHVSFSYGDRSIFKDFNYSFAKKKYALCGESGSGKSTLMKLLLGLNKADAGQVCVDDKDIKELALRSYFRHLSYIEQNVYLLNDTIRENILLGSKIPAAKLQAVLQIAKLDKFVASLPNGLDTVVSSNGQEISGGEKQRIAIARALVKDVDFLFIDEATSQLDPSNRADIESILLDLEGVGIVMISHNFNAETLQKFDAVLEL